MVKKDLTEILEEVVDEFPTVSAEPGMKDIAEVFRLTPLEESIEDDRYFIRSNTSFLFLTDWFASSQTLTLKGIWAVPSQYFWSMWNSPKQNSIRNQGFHPRSEGFDLGLPTNWIVYFKPTHKRNL